MEKDQNLVVDPSKSTVSYDYKQELEVITTVKASKYKKDQGNLIETVLVSVARKNSLYVILVSLSATKRAIFTGLILPNKSTVRKINKKY